MSPIYTHVQIPDLAIFAFDPGGKNYQLKNVEIVTSGVGLFYGYQVPNSSPVFGEVKNGEVLSINPKVITYFFAALTTSSPQKGTLTFGTPADTNDPGLPAELALQNLASGTNPPPQSGPFSSIPADPAETYFFNAQNQGYKSYIGITPNSVQVGVNVCVLTKNTGTSSSGNYYMDCVGWFNNGSPVNEETTFPVGTQTIIAAFISKSPNSTATHMEFSIGDPKEDASGDFEEV